MKKISIFLTFIFLALLIPHTALAKETFENSILDVPSDKIWTLTFNDFIDEKSIGDAVTIVDESGNVTKPRLEISADQTKLKVYPPNQGYQKGKQYTIKVSKSAKTIYGKPLKNPIEKSFIIEQEEIIDIQFKSTVIQNQQLQLAPNESYILFGGPNQVAEKYIVKNNQFKVGDIFELKPSKELPAGAVRKILAIELVNGQYIAKTAFPTLDEAFENFEVSATQPLTKKNIVAMVPNENVAVTGDADGWEFALLNYVTRLEGGMYGVNGSINFDNVKIHIDFDKENLKNGTHYTALSGTMHTNVSIIPQGKIPLGSKFFELKPNEVKLGTFTYVLPYGFTIQLHAGAVIKPSIILGATFSYTNSTDFMLGAVYQNEKFDTIERFSNRSNSAQSIQLGAEVKVGPRLTIEGGYATLAIVNLHQDVGIYANLMSHSILNSTKKCVSKEIGGFYDLTFQIPALKEVTIFNKYTPLSKKIPVLTKDDCSTVSHIEFNQTKYEIHENEPQQVQVNAVIKHLVNAETELAKISDQVIYTVDDSRILVSPTGNIYVKDVEQPFITQLHATYTLDGKQFKATAQLNINKIEEQVPWQQALNGVWRGEYTANQGVTGLTLTVKGNEALFEFGPVKENISVPSGSYSATVTYDEQTGKVNVKGLKWIQQPSGYEFVELIGELPLQDLFKGTVRNGSRQYSYSLQKTDIGDFISLKNLQGTWVGTYVGHQGETALTLVVEGDKATFNFGPIGTNTNSKKGSYVSKVKINPHSGLISIIGDEWISRPTNYTFADLYGTLQGDTLTGYLSGNRSLPFTIKKK